MQVIPILLLLAASTDGELAKEVEAVAEDPIVVTALRRPESIFKVPYSAETVDRKRFLNRQYRTTPQAFRDIPGVMVQETAPGQGSPYIRGFTGFRNLFLIDGVRLNNSTFRPGPVQYWNTVDPYSVQRFEVVKGPSSVLFGSDAIGGTVNAITRNPYGYGRRDKWSFAGAGVFRAATAEESFIARGEVSISYQERAGLLIGATPKQFGDLEAGDPRGVQRNTGYDEFAGDAKLEYFLKDGSRLVFLYQFVQQNNVPRWHRTLDNDVSFNGTTLGNEIQRDLDQTRQLIYGQWHKEDIGGVIDAVHVNLSYHYQDEVRDRIRSGDRRDKQGTTTGTIGLWAQFESDSPIGRLIYGAEWYHDNVNSFSTSNPVQGPVADDATYDIVAVYLQDEIDFNERSGIVIGVRWNYAAADADKVFDPVAEEQTSLSDSWNAFTASLRGRYEFVPDRWTVFGGASGGFRAPNLSDLTRFDSARSNEFEVPSPGLDPEYYWQFELGVKGRTRKFSIDASAFYTLIDDQILRTPTGDLTPDGEEIVIKSNVGDGYVWGIECGASWIFHPQWTLFGNVTYIEGKVDTFATSDPVITSEYLSRLMPLTGQIGVRWDNDDKRWWAETYVRMAARADRLSPRDEGDTQRIPPDGTPGYAVWSLRGGYNFTEKARAIVGFENLLNKNYRVHGSGQNMPGFNFIFTFSADF
ncbi:MAG: TonB-dependent receptor [Planctomycetota bacterium]